MEHEHVNKLMAELRAFARNYQVRGVEEEVGRGVWGGRIQMGGGVVGARDGFGVVVGPRN